MLPVHLQFRWNADLWQTGETDIVLTRKAERLIMNASTGKSTGPNSISAAVNFCQNDLVI